MYKNFFLGLSLTVIAQILTFVQLQGQFKFDWMKNNILVVTALGLPISFLYIISVKYLAVSFEGNMWPSRLLGFAVGAIVFTFMTKWWFNEPFTFKTGLCLLLATCIMGVQLFCK